MVGQARLKTAKNENSMMGRLKRRDTAARLGMAITVPASPDGSMQKCSMMAGPMGPSFASGYSRGPGENPSARRPGNFFFARAGPGKLAFDTVRW